jgi:hypothetical protein
MGDPFSGNLFEKQEGQNLKPLGNGLFEDAEGNVVDKNLNLINEKLDPELQKALVTVKKLYGPDETQESLIKLAQILLREQKKKKT